MKHNVIDYEFQIVFNPAYAPNEAECDFLNFSLWFIQRIHRMRYNVTVYDFCLCLIEHMHRMKHNVTVYECRLVFNPAYAQNEA